MECHLGGLTVLCQVHLSNACTSPSMSPCLLTPGLSVSAPRYIRMSGDPPLLGLRPERPSGSRQKAPGKWTAGAPSLQDAREINSWTPATVLGPT